MPNPILLQKMTEMAELARDSMSKQEVMEAIRAIIELVKKMKEDHRMATSEMDNKYAQMLSSIMSQLKGSDVYNEIVSKVKEDAVFGVDELKRSTGEYTVAEMMKVHERHEKLVSDLEARLAKIKKEVMPDMDSISKAISTKTQSSVFNSVLNAITKNLRKMGKVIVEALSSLPEDQKLEIKDIKKLRKELDDLRLSIQSRSGGMGVATQGMTMRTYDLSDSLDGVTKTFNIPTNWRIIGVYTSSFPNALRPTTDYTYTPTTITFTSEIEASTTLASGQTVVIEYLSTV